MRVSRDQAIKRKFGGHVVRNVLRSEFGDDAFPFYTSSSEAYIVPDHAADNHISHPDNSESAAADGNTIHSSTKANPKTPQRKIDHKAVGEFMRAFKREYHDFDAWVHDTPEHEIARAVLEFYSTATS